MKEILLVIMPKIDYDNLQKLLSRKIQTTSLTGKRKEGYEEAILAAKSVLSDWYHQHFDKGGSTDNEIQEKADCH